MVDLKLTDKDVLHILAAVQVVERKLMGKEFDQWADCPRWRTKDDPPLLSDVYGVLRRELEFRLREHYNNT